ncbi:MAG: hypothetical protein ACR2QM_09735 [Longimicrobiales bacterium]
MCKPGTGLAVVLCLFALGTDGAVGQTKVEAEVGGVWSVRWASGVRSYPDGRFEVQRWGEATLALEVDGERVEGTWTHHLSESVTWTVAGSFVGGTLRLEAIGNDSSNPELDLIESIVWLGRIEEGEIKGTVSMKLKGRDKTPAARPFSGVRQGRGQDGDPAAGPMFPR